MTHESSEPRPAPFVPVADHPGDRVMFDGREYRVAEFDTRTGLAWLVSETPEYESPGQVNMDHLTLSWCPRSHGGSGKPRRWRMYGGRYPEVFHGREFKVVGGHPRYVQAYGCTPVPVDVVERADGDYWGWIDKNRGETEPVMIQPHWTLFSIQFPYSPQAEAEAGRGEVVRLHVTTATDN